MSELVNREQLRSSSGQAYATIEAAIKAAGLAPVHSVKFGKGTMALYSKAEAEKALDAFVRAKEAQAQAQQLTQQPAAPVDLEPILAAVEALAEQCQAADVRAVERSRLHFKVSEGNAAALLVITRDLTARLDRIESAIAALHAIRSAAAPAQPPREPAPAPSPTPPAVGPRVAIVGLLASQVQLITREFASCLDLVFFSADEITGKSARAQIQGCQHVLTMVKFTGHTAESTFKGAGVSPIRITGGMSMLRDKLTALFVAAGERVPA